MAGKTAWRIVGASRDKLGESPQWDHRTGDFYWVDFFGPTIRRLSADGARRDWTLKGFTNIGSVVLCADARLLIGVEKGLFFFDPRDGSVTPFADPNDGRQDILYNDAKVDRHGNYWVGTCDAPETAPRGIFYGLNRQGKWHVADSGFAVCNGPSFSPKGEVLYFSDSMGRQSLAYDLDPAGRLSNRRVFQTYTAEDGFPDGLCVDAQGFIWVAMYDGGKVLRLSPEGGRVATLTLPVRNVTSCCLGGKDLRTLFVTTAQAADGSEPDGGAVFALEVEIPGLPEPIFQPSGARS